MFIVGFHFVLPNLQSRRLSFRYATRSHFILPNLQIRRSHYRSSDRTSFYPTYRSGDRTQEDVFRADIQIAKAIASLELVNYQKRQIYCEEKLSNLDPSNQDDLVIIQYYVQENCLAIQKIKQLEQERLKFSQDYVL